MSTKPPASFPLGYRQVGGTGVRVSAMALGAAPLGGLYQRSSLEDATATVRAAFEAGINYVDVAPHYGRGLAELRLGAAFSGVRNPDLVLSTKVGRILEPSDTAPVMANWPEALPYEARFDPSPDGIRRSVADSRKRLGRDALDILLLHDPDRYAEGDELRAVIATAYDGLSALRAEGSVRAIGIGVNGPVACHMALDIGQWDCFLLAGTYSVLRQDDDGLLARCRAAGTSIFIGGPYMSGALAGGSTWRYGAIPAEVSADIARLDALCREHGVSMQAAALQFPLMNPAVSSVIVGMRSPVEVRQNMAFLAETVPPAFWQALVRERLVAPGHVEAGLAA